MRVLNISGSIVLDDILPKLCIVPLYLIPEIPPLLPTAANFYLLSSFALAYFATIFLKILNKLILKSIVKELNSF
jgi:hypothetical protein